jgi:aspartate aminotransferase-like enzyme
MLETMERWVETHPGVGLMAPAGHRSPAISALRLSEGRPPAAILQALSERGYLIGGGLDPRHGPVIRIGHMGDLEPEHLVRLLGELEGLLA